MNVGIIAVRKRWNNAPSFLLEGLKDGLRAVAEKDGGLSHDFVFSRFTVHDQRGRLAISPESVAMFDAIVVPFWIGPYLLECNLADVKTETGVKIVTYTGRSLFFNETFGSTQGEISQGGLTNAQWRNFLAIDRFLVVKKLSTHSSEREIGCGQFADLLRVADRPPEIGAVIDFCKNGWDEPIWNELAAVHEHIVRMFPEIVFVQLGDGPARLRETAVWRGEFCPYRRMCRLYSRSRLFFAMNESFGYPVLENQFAGTPVLVHESADLPSFHSRSKHVIMWNRHNILSIVEEALDADRHGRDVVRADFTATFPELVSWEQTARRMIDELAEL